MSDTANDVVASSTMDSGLKKWMANSLLMEMRRMRRQRELVDGTAYNWKQEIKNNNKEFVHFMSRWGMFIGTRAANRESKMEILYWAFRLVNEAKRNERKKKGFIANVSGWLRSLRN